MTARSWASGSEATLQVAIEVLRRGPISRTEIARRMNLSTASLTRLSAPLLEQGLIRDVGELNDGLVGRPHRLLDVSPASQYFIGMKMQENELIGALTDLRSTVIATKSLPIEDRAPAAVVDLVAQLVEELSAGVPIAGVGIGMGASVRDRSHVESAYYLGWRDVPFAQSVLERIGIPTVIDNDVAAFTEFERWYGHGRDDERFAVVTLGRGTGYGLVANGTLVSSDDYGLGLVGHWPIDPNGPLCSEGHRGCAESLLTLDTIARRVSQALGRRVDISSVLDLAEEGQGAARRVVDEAGRALGRLLAAVENLTLPERIIVGGEGVRFAATARKAIDTEIAANRPTLASTIPLVLASGHNDEWCRGAAVLAIQAFVRAVDGQAASAGTPAMP